MHSCWYFVMLHLIFQRYKMNSKFKLNWKTQSIKKRKKEKGKGKVKHSRWAKKHTARPHALPTRAAQQTVGANRWDPPIRRPPRASLSVGSLPHGTRAQVRCPPHMTAVPGPLYCGPRLAASSPYRATDLLTAMWALLSVFWIRPHTRGCPSRCF
jgi:hypothetical protein